MRSLATREAGQEISDALPDVIAACKVAGFDLIVVETSGIGQGDAAIVPLVDASLYVMTPEFGAASQLEKIDMLDFADFVAINKFDRKGAADALRDVAKQVQRNREAWTTKPEDLPVYGTQASKFNDDGVTALYQGLLPKLASLGLKVGPGRLPQVATHQSTATNVIVPSSRARYLAEIADTVRGYLRRSIEQSRVAREVQQVRSVAAMLVAAGDASSASVAPAKAGAQSFVHEPLGPGLRRGDTDLGTLLTSREAQLDAASRKLLAMWPQMQAAYAGDEYVVRDPRQGDPHRPDDDHAVRHQDPQGRAAEVRGRRRGPEMADARERAGLVPVHRRRLRVQAQLQLKAARTRRGCSPAKATRSAPTAASSC